MYIYIYIYLFIYLYVCIYIYMHTWFDRVDTVTQEHRGLYLCVRIYIHMCVYNSIASYIAIIWGHLGYIGDIREWKIKWKPV